MSLELSIITEALSLLPTPLFNPLPTQNPEFGTSDAQAEAQQNIESLREEIRQFEVQTTKTEARLEALRGIGIDVSKWLQKAEDRSGSQELLSVGGEQGGREGENGWPLKCGREGGRENYMYISWTIIVENCVPHNSTHVCLPLSHFPLYFSPPLPSLTFVLFPPLPFSPPPSPLFPLPCSIKPPLHALPKQWVTRV